MGCAQKKKKKCTHVLSSMAKSITHGTFSIAAMRVMQRKKSLARMIIHGGGGDGQFHSDASSRRKAASFHLSPGRKNKTHPKESGVGKLHLSCIRAICSSSYFLESIAGIRRRLESRACPFNDVAAANFIAAASNEFSSVQSCCCRPDRKNKERQCFRWASAAVLGTHISGEKSGTTNDSGERASNVHCISATRHIRR